MTQRPRKILPKVIHSVSLNGLKMSLWVLRTWDRHLWQSLIRQTQISISESRKAGDDDACMSANLAFIHERIHSDTFRDDKISACLCSYRKLPSLPQLSVSFSKIFSYTSFQNKCSFSYPTVCPAGRPVIAYSRCAAKHCSNPHRFILKSCSNDKVSKDAIYVGLNFWGKCLQSNTHFQSMEFCIHTKILGSEHFFRSFTEELEEAVRAHTVYSVRWCWMVLLCQPESYWK